MRFKLVASLASSMVGRPYGYNALRVYFGHSVFYSYLLSRYCMDAMTASLLYDYYNPERGQRYGSSRPLCLALSSQYAASLRTGLAIGKMPPERHRFRLSRLNRLICRMDQPSFKPPDGGWDAE